jgi:CRISPR-associated protein Csh2
MDYQSRRNLVSDVRLKRYVRDYLQDKGNKLYVERPEDGKVVNASTRIKNALGHTATVKDRDQIMKELVDVRLFGATITIKEKGESSGDSISITGPVQFTWGYSLNEVDLVDSYSITSTFSSGEEKKHGTFGKDYRVYYSLIGFYGIISGHRAGNTGMSVEDSNLLDQCLVKAIPQQATRSKIGQFPRLYLRIQYKDQETVIGDLRETISLKSKAKLRGINDVTLELDSLSKKLADHKDLVDRIIYWQDSTLKLEKEGTPTKLSEIFREAGITHNTVNA